MSSEGDSVSSCALHEGGWSVVSQRDLHKQTWLDQKDNDGNGMSQSRRRQALAEERLHKKQREGHGRRAGW